MQRLPLHSGINSKFISMLLLPFFSSLTILVRQWGERANNDPVLVLNAKGGEIKGQSRWISYHLRILKIVELELLICQNTLIVKIWSLVGRIYDYGKTGEFLNLDHFHS
jgi:hypothetical protein